MGKHLSDYELEQLVERIAPELRPQLIRLLNEFRELRDTRAERLYSEALDTDWSDG